MKKIVFALIAVCAFQQGSYAYSYQSKLSRVLWGHSIDVAQATLLFCFAHGISSQDKIRLERPLSSMMSSGTFRLLSMANLARAAFAAYTC